MVIYAIGDVHGRLDLLRVLLDQVGADAAVSCGEEAPVIVMLGDYIDRGPDSAGVVNLVRELTQADDVEVRALKGNHEDAMLSFLQDPQIGPTWANFGGLETIRSYGVRPPARMDDPEAWEVTRQALDIAVPDAHKTFLATLEPYAVYGDYCFVHAGLRPGVALVDQKEGDLLTIRQEFLNHRRPFEKFVVYGHTPNIDPVVETHRIGIDTGAFATGVLTCLKLSGADQTMLQARL